jgi:hypothetical protein
MARRAEEPGAPPDSEIFRAFLLENQKGTRIANDRVCRSSKIDRTKDARFCTTRSSF